MRTRRRPQLFQRRQSSAAPELPARSQEPIPAPRRRPAPDLDEADAPARRRALRIVAFSGALVVLLTGLVVAAVLTLPRFERVSPQGATRDATPTLELVVANGADLTADDVYASVDGRPLVQHVRVRGDRVFVDVPRLEDGTHEFEVTAQGVGPLRRDISTEWTLRIDTVGPGARAMLPKRAEEVDQLVPSHAVPLRSRAQQLAVRTEPGAAVEVTSSAPGTRVVTATADSQGVARVAADLAEGEQSLRVAATDGVGNVSRWGARVIVDSVGPALAAKLPVVTKNAELDLLLTLRDARGVNAEVVFDGGADGIVLTEIDEAGNPISTEEGGDDEDAQEVAGEDAEPDAAAPEAEEGGAVTAVLSVAVSEHSGSEDEVAETDSVDEGETTDDSEPLPTVARYRLTSEDPLYEGRHELTITARDALGNQTNITRALIVNSAETLADVEGLRKGARGRDVRELHLALIEEKAVTRAQLGADFTKMVYGQRSRAAVSGYQTKQGLDVDGMAGRATIASLLYRIVIDQSDFSLTLFAGKQVVKRYGVATGSPSYPTPFGEFVIVNKQENPTWTPPDSDWAKGAKPIPPGPNNPLGTRWIGLDAPNIGIHGTIAPSSIGSAASHGCIRMAIPDVEDLFERVEIGTPVSIVP